MKILEMKDLSFTYPEQTEATLKNISFEIREGELVYICGPTGAGKSTLLHCLKREIWPRGTMIGSILFCGCPMEGLPSEDLIRDIGIVFQDPDSQTVMDTVMGEMSFGLENLGLPPAEIKQRLSEVAGYFGVEPLFQKTYQHLSGGERQTVNLCSVLAMRPKVLLLDEPVSQMDPVAQAEFTGMIKRINEEFGITVLINEHRNEELMACADKVLILDHGQIRYFGAPRDVAKKIIANGDKKALSLMPASARLFALASGLQKETLPMTIKEARQMVRKHAIFEQKKEYRNLKMHEKQPQKGMATLTADNLLFSYCTSQGKTVLKNLDFVAESGDFIGIAGGNGSGKSTLLKLMCGLYEPLDGTVKVGKENIKKMKRDAICNEIFYIPQSPLTYFTFDTVEKELTDAAKKGKKNQTEVESIFRQFELTAHLAKHPYDLSGGERQKILLACAMLRDTKILLLDEATKGLDPQSKKELGDMLTALSHMGKTIIMVSHDLEFMASYAKICALLFDGNLSVMQDTRTFFRDNYFYTTNAKRIFREALPEILTIEEVAVGEKN